MGPFRKIIQREFLVLRQDVTRHIAYSLLLIIVSSCSTYLLVFFISPQRNKTEIPQQVHIDQKIPASPIASDENYTERGSPYDNRTVGSESANVIFHGSRDKKQIALTFDAEMTDGMRANVVSGRVKSSYDPQIVETLIKTNTKATLFLTGMWIELYPDVTTQLSKNPLFELGSHSYTDSSYAGFCYGLSQLADTLKVEDIGATEKLLREHAHIDNRLFRFPGGCYTPSDVKLVNQANDTVVHWDVVGADGFNNDANQIVRNVVNNVQNGSIIVLHINGGPTAPKTADALPQIIATLKSKGYEFVKLNELLGFPAEQVSN